MSIEERLANIESTLDVHACDYREMENRTNILENEILVLINENDRLYQKCDLLERYNSNTNMILDPLLSPDIFYNIVLENCKIMGASSGSSFSILDSASFIASVFHSNGNSSNIYRESVWVKLYERFIDVNIESVDYDELGLSVDAYTKNITRNGRGFCTYNIFENAPLFAEYLRNSYSYLDISTLYMSTEAHERFLSSMIVMSLGPSHSREYMKYVFRHCDANTLKSHVNITFCEVVPELEKEYYELVYSVLSNVNHLSHKELVNDDSYIKKIRNRSNKINNFYKLNVNV